MMTNNNCTSMCIRNSRMNNASSNGKSSRFGKFQEGVKTTSTIIGASYMLYLMGSSIYKLHQRRKEKELQAQADEAKESRRAKEHERKMELSSLREERLRQRDERNEQHRQEDFDLRCRKVNLEERKLQSTQFHFCPNPKEALDKSQTLDEIQCSEGNRCLVSDWFGTDSINLLVARSNDGKSRLAMEMAYYIASGGRDKSACVFLNTADIPAQPAQNVLYLNFEMDDDQVKSLYPQDNKFSSNIRVVSDFESLETSYILGIINRYLNSMNGDVTIFVDNLQDMEVTKRYAMADFFEQLKAICKDALATERKVSFVLLCQVRDIADTRLIEKNDINGSKVIFHRADNVAALEHYPQQDNYAIHILKSRLGCDRDAFHILHKSKSDKYFTFQETVYDFSRVS